MKSWTYEKAGVPHLKGDPDYNRKITNLIRSTNIPGVMGSATGFASLFDLRKFGARDPLLVTSTDGVGTKLELARLLGRHDTIGIDLVAMCVNDIITCGAQPIIFLDYFATGKFSSKVMEEVLKGVTDGCRESGCALTGGETAIMPGFYENGHHGAPQYDIAGFCVGVVDRKRLITGESIRPGDAVLGLASSGFHSNGYSLLRRVFSEKQLRGPSGRALLRPTRIYVRPIQKLLKSVPVGGIANITGGGFVDNIPRVLPNGVGVDLDPALWPRDRLFKTVQDSGGIDSFEMYRTFNMGIGMVVILRPKAVKTAQRVLKGMGFASWVIGETVRRTGAGPRVNILY